MAQTPDRQASDVVLDVVVELLETGGYDAVQLREVARRARLSLSTIYAAFPTRSELIVSAIERWMEVNYAEVPKPDPDEPFDKAFIRGLRAVHEPWERSPRMLEAMHRALLGPGGERLTAQGMSAFEALAQAGLEQTDPEFFGDFAMILHNVSEGLVARFAAGQIAVTEILPMLERTVTRLAASAPRPPAPP